jgi:hypothetical protein
MMEHITMDSMESKPDDQALAHAIQLFLGAYRERIKPLNADQEQLEWLTEDLAKLLKSFTEHAELIDEQPALMPTLPPVSQSSHPLQIHGTFPALVSDVVANNLNPDVAFLVGPVLGAASARRLLSRTQIARLS